MTQAEVPGHRSGKWGDSGRAINWLAEHGFERFSRERSEMGSEMLFEVRSKMMAN